MDQYTFPDKLKRMIFIMGGIGIVAILLGVLTDHTGHLGQRFWSNLLIDGFFFFGIALIGTFFLAVQYAAEAGWGIVLKRIMEAVSSYLPIGAGVLIIVFLAGTFHFHHLYHWMAEGIDVPGHENYDAIIAGKKPYLTQWFFWLRTILYIGVWVWFTHIFRKRSLIEDQGGSVKFHYKNVTLSAIFLVFFGYTSMTASWDWLMSIDTHWFSTIYGWYIFSGMWISGMVVMLMITLHLKSKGHLKEVNESHIHDMGKWVFGISFLWSYLFFCQFMLIWYSNIPEEVTYYLARIQDYTWIFWGTFLINFLFPMLLLMSKDAKRNSTFLIFVGVIIFFGHWMDVFMLVTPGTMKDHGDIGLMEIGMFLVFLGIFSFVVLNALSKRPLLVKNHPMLDESIHHHI